MGIWLAKLGKLAAFFLQFFGGLVLGCINAFLVRRTQTARPFRVFGKIVRPIRAKKKEIKEKIPMARPAVAYIFNHSCLLAAE